MKKFTLIEVFLDGHVEAISHGSVPLNTHADVFWTGQ
jgi:hypothetical protein